MEKKRSQPVEKPISSANGLLKVFRIEDVSVSIFARERQLRGSTVTFYSVSFSRSYKDAAGMRKYTKNFDSQDLGALATLIQQAGEFIRAQQGPDVA